MRALLAAVVLVVGCGRSEDAAVEVASQTQALGTAWLLEIDGQSAGFVSSVTSGSGGAPCGASSLRFTLGPNMSASARAWLDAALTKAPGQHLGSIWIASTNQRLNFSIATVPSVAFPLAESGNSAQVYFTVNTTGSSGCVAVTPSLMSQKTQLANTFAARYALAKDVVVRLGPTTMVAPTRTTSFGYGSFEFGDLTVEHGSAQSQAAIDYANAILNNGFIEDSEYGESVVAPRDQFGQPIVAVRWYGPLIGADAGTPTLPVFIRVSRPHIAAVLPDGGIP